MMLPIDLNLLNQTPAKYKATKRLAPKSSPTLIQKLVARLMASRATGSSTIVSQR